MQYIDKRVEYLGLCPSDEEDILVHIESCGRRCYRSEHKIDYENGSHVKFYNMLTKNGHVSAIEHSNIILRIYCDSLDEVQSVYASFLNSAYTQMGFFRTMINEEDTSILISANIRAWLEFFRDKWWFALYEEAAGFLAAVYPTVFAMLPIYVEENSGVRYDYEYREADRVACGNVEMDIVGLDEQIDNYNILAANDMLIFTFAIYTDRGISHEIVRHRVMSFSQESTRYVNYKNSGIGIIQFEMPGEFQNRFENTMVIIEGLYNDMIAAGVKPQLARNVLPNCLKTEMAMSGRLSGWDHFIELRNSKAAHPDIQFVAREIMGCLGYND